MDSSTALQDGMVYGVTYANGPLNVALDNTQYGNNSLAAATARNVNRTRISASYNLGIAVVGAGYEMRDAKTSSTATALTTKDTIISVNVPVGSYDFAAAYATSKTDGNSYTVTGIDLAARYNFSKRTYAALRYQSVQGVNLNIAYAAANEGKITQLQLAHSF
jgi:predicted porin